MATNDGSAWSWAPRAAFCSATRQDAADWLAKMNQRGHEAWSHWQRLFPLVDEAGRLRGVLTLRWPFGRQHRVEGAIEGSGETHDERSGLEEAQAKIEIGLD